MVEAGTYEELVASTSEDVLFDLYAPWCILCARNKPVYEELASRISEVNQQFYAYSHSRIPQARHSTLRYDTTQILLNVRIQYSILL